MPQSKGEGEIERNTPQESQHSHQALQCWTLHHSWLPPAPVPTMANSAPKSTLHLHSTELLQDCCRTDFFPIRTGFANMKNRRYGIQPSNTTSNYQNCSFHKFRGKSSMQIPWRQQTHDLTRLPFLPALHSHQDCQHDKQARHKLKGLSRNCRKK